jgi:outer membrane immunogenic protein
MHKTLLLASTLSLAGAAAAAAQTPDVSWTGPYVGLHAGINLRNDHVDTRGATPANQAAVDANARPATIVLDRNGALGGAQAGYNQQLGSFVAGVEADIASVDANGSQTYSSPQAFGAAAAGTRSYTSAKLNYLGTARARFGYLATPRDLLYVTGGYAYGQPKYRTTFANSAGAVQFAGDKSYTASGWAAGAGYEHALPLNLLGTRAATLRAEWLHYDHGDKKLNVAAVPNVGAGAYIASFRTRGDELRAAVNVKF